MTGWTFASCDTCQEMFTLKLNIWNVTSFFQIFIASKFLFFQFLLWHCHKILLLQKFATPRSHFHPWNFSKFSFPRASDISKNFGDISLNYNLILSVSKMFIYKLLTYLTLVQTNFLVLYIQNSSNKNTKAGKGK